MEHTEAEIYPFMKYRDIFHKKSYLMMLCQIIYITVTLQFSFLYNHRRIYVRRNS